LGGNTPTLSNAMRRQSQILGKMNVRAQ